MRNAQTEQFAHKGRQDVYQRITERIVALLEAGTVPWRLPWKSDGPRNLISKRPYRGINAFLLNAMCYTSPYWLTFLQVQSLGAKVRRGERACPVVLWKWIKVEDEEEEIPFVRCFAVFNVQQMEGLPAGAIPATEDRPFNPIEEAERIIEQMPNRPEIRYGGSVASYQPADDVVNMPRRECFKSAEVFYNTIYHELTHSVGHKSRLARKGVTDVQGFGSDPYAREELVAEMGAAFLCGHCGIERTLDQSAAYIQGWLKRIRSEPRLLIQAAAQAQKAADYILGRQAAEVTPECGSQPTPLLTRN